MKMGLFLFLLSFAGFAANANSTYSGCDQFGSEVNLEFKGEIKLNQKFFNSKNKTEIEDAIIQQLKYARGYYINLRNQLPYSLTLAANNPQIEILTTEKQNYGQSLKIDYIKHPNVQHSNPYIKKAMSKKWTRENDKALRVTYNLKTTANYCGAKNSLENIKVLLPTDPYLAYWSVLPKNRRLITWRHVSGVINPCANPELADIPDPYYYWYFWNPLNSGKDSNKKSFSCSELMKANTHYIEVALNLNPKVDLKINTQTKNKSELSSAVNIATVFGVIDETAHILPWKQMVADLKKLPKIDMTDLKKMIAKETTGTADTKLWDRGSEYFIDFIQNLDSVLKVNSVSFNQSENEIFFEGQLIKSGKNYKLSVMFGFTDILGRNPAEHWSFLKNSISNADYVIYNGHSGLGENIKISNILDFTGTKLDDLFKNSPKYQMIAYMSCYSYGYFGDDIVELRKKLKPESNTEIILTGTEFTSYRGPYGVFDYVDNLITGKNSKIDGSKWLFPEDQLILKSFSNIKSLEMEKK